MVHGPVDFIMVGFEGSEITPHIAEGLKDLIKNDTIHIIDLVFVQKNDDGDLSILELDQLPPETASTWNAVVHDVEGMLTLEDAMHLAADLPRNRAAVIALYENTWAREMVRIIQQANGEILATTRIPAAVIAELEIGLNEDTTSR